MRSFWSRECLVLEIGRSITAEDVKDQLIWLFMVRGVPEYIRSDNGPEFIARAIRSWLERSEVKTLYVQAGAPWENGYAESFYSRLRDEFLNVEEFRDVREARALAQAWQREYNHDRPHSSLGYKTPVEFAKDAPEKSSLIASGT